jgi:hypothetical protein
MKQYCPLAVHCTSLCLDIIQDEKFESLSHQDINNFYVELYQMVEARTCLNTFHYARESAFVNSVTNGVLKALHICKNHRSARNSTWLLSVMESRISSTIQKLT